MRFPAALLTAALLLLVLAPPAEARSVTREYFVGESAMIVFMSNYYVGDWDVSGNRFNVVAGESTVRIAMQGDPSSSVLEVLDGQSHVLASAAFCDASPTVALPAGARFVRVLAGSDSTAAAFYANAVACGVGAPPAHGFITAEFA